MNNRIKTSLLYVSSIIVYGIFIVFFTSTSHVGFDEELYVSLARSFHYEGQFAYGNQLLNYSCVLYSMLISLAYFIYSPETILFFMRMIGVVTMCSAVFPIYLLARDILKDDKKAFWLSAFMLMMPYMLDCAYLMQEVLSYPLFMWTLYFLYRAQDSERKKFVILAAIFSVLCIFTKTYMLFIPICLNLCSFYYYGTKINRSKDFVVNVVIYDLIYVIFFAGAYWAIWAINGFHVGSNHYSGQISNLFPVGLDTLVFGGIGFIIYAAFLIINMGLIPVGAVLYEWRHGNEKFWLKDFVIISIPFLILEIVFMIFLTEEGVGTLPHKFYFRYFQIFVPPILIFFMKLNSIDIWTGFRKCIFLLEASLGTAACYFVVLQGKTRQAIIDGHLFLLAENLARYFLPYIDALIMALLMIGILCLRKKQKMLEESLKIGIVGVLILWIVVAIELPYYNNVIVNGRQIQQDSIKIAEYLNKETYENVYYVYEKQEGKNRYLRNFYGYIRQSYDVISETEIDALIDGKQRTALLCPSDLSMRKNGFQLVDLNNEELFLYVSEYE